jgi:peptide deformylase
MQDPVQQMKVEEKRRAVQKAEVQEKAREEFQEAVNEALPESVKGGQALELVLHPDERLKQTCAPVEKFGSELRDLLQDMGYTMYLCGGVGLASPQVGQLQRMFVADWSGNKGKLIQVVNPEVLEVSPKFGQEIEGCLSFPAVRVPVERPAAIRAHWWNERGQEVDLWLDGWAARIFLHELDHLEGVTYLDRVAPFTRRMALKKLGKVREKVDRDRRRGRKRMQKRSWRG